MQTFFTSTDFETAAAQLDNRRLGKQRVEAYQILRALIEPDYGWRHHPAVKMWRGHISALAKYGLIVCNEWLARGYQDTVKAKIEPYLSYDNTIGLDYPAWLTEEFASSHRSILLGKAIDSCKAEQWAWYTQFNWLEQPAQRVNGKWPYWWSV